ncbi:MAG TPA: imelysin family protein [Polyangiaceae bacterium]|nr:imelysin family protein [Polyangiaceae bacterium]
MKTQTLLSVTSLLSLLATAPACSDDTTPDSGTGGGGGAAADLSAMPQVAENYADIVLASYRDALSAAQDLDAAVDAFVAEPSEEALAAARLAWKASRPPYLQTEVFRFYDGPIDDPEDGPEGLLNAWPLDENYIDYTVDAPDSGIVNDATQEITAEALLGLNEQGGEKNIATGYHAVEFLLWGQDLSTDGPGARPFTDYTTADNADRRAEYLQVVTGLIVDELSGLVDAWELDQDNYRKAFLAEAPEEQLRRILTGMITLSGFETGGERLQTAYDTRDQEDEHSCFSDNTHVDMIEDVRGIQNVYLGQYQTLAGETVGDVDASVRALIESHDAELADELTARIAESLTLAEDLEVPFDQGIVSGNDEGRAKVAALIDSLRAKQEKLLEQGFRDFGLAIPAPE